MRALWHDSWGSGRGPAVRLAPEARIAAGAALFAASLAAPAGTGRGIALIAFVATAWTAACGMPLRAVKSFALLGAAMFLPYFLLVPLLTGAGTPGPSGQGGFLSALAAPWDVVLHGFAGLFLTAATVTSLSASDFRRGVLALPLPRLVTGVVIQIVHQTAVLFAETGSVAAAIAVRSGSGRAGTVLRVLASVPRVWLPRIIHRADRVSAAMELRGYAETDLRVMGPTKPRAADAAAIGAAVGLLALAAAIRWDWIR